MIKFSFFIFSLFFTLYTSAQHCCVAFMNSDSTLYGFKNAQGIVIAEPKFTLVGNEQFKDIVAVIEQVTEDLHSSYYLRSDGSKFAVDSVYYWDNALDIESDGFIRFKDPITRKVGVLNAKGEVILAAEFDEMKPIRNGFIWAIRGAHKECWDKEVPVEDCEHADWVGGEKLLYNVKGELLSRNFFSNSDDFVNLDYYTFKKSKKPSKDPLRVNFKADGKGYFSFVNLDKSFEVWVKKNWFDNPTIEQANVIIPDSIVDYREEGWAIFGKNDFFMFEVEKFHALLTMLKGTKFNYYCSYQDDFYLYEFKHQFGKYFNGPYQFNQWKFPLYNVTIENKLNGEQTNLDFLRTEKGWKLVSITLR